MSLFGHVFATGVHLFSYNVHSMTTRVIDPRENTQARTIMKYRRVGHSGLKVSEIALGSWITFGGQINKEQSIACLEKAHETGINFIDTADIYAAGKAEEVVGSYIKDLDRKDVVLSSKVFWPTGKGPNDSGSGRKHVLESIEASLQRLNTDYLDIYFCHHYDLHTPLEETVLAMTNLIERGKILYWGTSVWRAHQIERVCGIARDLGAIPPIVEQPRYNMLDRRIERDVLDALSHNKMGLTTWSSLHYGLLTGKYVDGIPPGSRVEKNENFKKITESEDDAAKVRKLVELAAELELPMSNLALAWILREPTVSAAITGASRPEQIEMNVQATEVSLDKDTLARIEEILANKPEITYPYNTNQRVD